MRITKLYIKEYKNLKDFHWEPNPESPVAVIVGKNASGKTNLLEAIMMIFQQVLLFPYKENRKRNMFNVVNKDINIEFELSYQYGVDDYLVEIQNNGKNLIILKNNKKIPLNEIDSPFQLRQMNRLASHEQPRERKDEILPENIFLYYAGISNRFIANLKELESRFYFGIIDEKITNGRSVINYEPIHYKAVMLALLLSPLKDIRKFLARNFGITGLQRLKIVIGKPPRTEKGNAGNYWEAPAIIKNWIDRLRKYAKVERNGNQQIFFFDAENFNQETIREFEYEFGLFQILDSLYVTHYLKEIEIYFNKDGVQQPIEFDQLSEGEKQRLAIRGAMEIFRGKETLFLLDEPDAFAHPRWQWKFIPDLNKAIGDKTYSQVIFATHSPLVLSTAKDNTFFMENGKIEPIHEVHGMDVNSVLINAMDSDKRTQQVEIDFEKYFSLIESGKGESEKAKNMRVELEKMYPLNHPSFSKADMLIALYR